jgi:hypothetical protein
MWKILHDLLIEHPKALGIAGDSLTFLGGLLLAAEALWKKRERTAIATKETTAQYFPNAEDREGNPISPSEVEQRYADTWDAMSKIGAIAMTAGFFFLLISRIFAE